MRCLSIAQALQKRGEEVVFATSGPKGREIIEAKGFQAICLCSPWDDYSPEDIREILTKHTPSMLLIDSYYVSREYWEGIKPGVRTAYMDDLGVSGLPVDYLINYNVYANDLNYDAYKGSKTKLMLMPLYAPLRDEFCGITRHCINQKVQNIMVSAGGADPNGITSKLIEQVCPVMRDITFHFVIGMLNPRIGEIKERAGNNVVLHINEKNMSMLMKECDMAVSAAGSTLYELCACGTPTITYTLADNQQLAAEVFAREGIMMSAGDYRNDVWFSMKLRSKIENLAEDYNLREQLSVMMQNVVDGRGADRIAEQLIE